MVKTTPEFIGEPNWLRLAQTLAYLEAQREGAIVKEGSVTVRLKDGRVLGEKG